MVEGAVYTAKRKVNSTSYIHNGVILARKFEKMKIFHCTIEGMIIIYTGQA